MDRFGEPWQLRRTANKSENGFQKHFGGFHEINRFYRCFDFIIWCSSNCDFVFFKDVYNLYVLVFSCWQNTFLVTCLWYASVFVSGFVLEPYDRVALDLMHRLIFGRCWGWISMLVTCMPIFNHVIMWVYCTLKWYPPIVNHFHHARAFGTTYLPYGSIFGVTCWFKLFVKRRCVYV